jgi:hypothetical protein
MADQNKNATVAQGAFRFRVSDSLEVPLRGHMLRLRLLEGSPSMKELGRGRKLGIVSPAGERRTVKIIDHSATGGRATQSRLDTTRELDVVISSQDAGEGRDRIGIGWFAGPAR